MALAVRHQLPARRRHHRRVVQDVVVALEHAEHERGPGLGGQLRHPCGGRPVQRLGQLPPPPGQHLQVVPAGHQLRGHHQLGPVGVLAHQLGEAVDVGRKLAGVGRHLQHNDLDGAIPSPPRRTGHGRSSGSAAANSRSGGRIARIEPAETRSSWSRCGCWRLASPTVIGLWSASSSVRAMSRSFQTKTKSMMANDTIPGRASGSAIVGTVERSRAVDPRGLQQLVRDRLEEAASMKIAQPAPKAVCTRAMPRYCREPALRPRVRNQGRIGIEDDLDRHDHGGEEHRKRSWPEPEAACRRTRTRPGCPGEPSAPWQDRDDEAVDRVPDSPCPTRGGSWPKVGRRAPSVRHQPWCSATAAGSRSRAALSIGTIQTTAHDGDRYSVRASGAPTAVIETCPTQAPFLRRNGRRRRRERPT